MGRDTPDLPQGTLDLLILKVLDLEPMHGWGVSKRIRQMSAGVLEVNQGSLYPALHRLERKGWLQAAPGRSESGRQVKLYRLSRAGRRQLSDQRAQWRLVATAIEQILAADGP